MAAVEKWAALAPSQLPYTTVADLDPAQIKSRQQQGQELQELQPQLQSEPSPSPQQFIFPGACGDILYIGNFQSCTVLKFWIDSTRIVRTSQGRYSKKVSRQRIWRPC